MQPEEIQTLVQRYFDGSATPAEKQLLDKWYQEGQTDPVKWFAQSENEEELLRLEMLYEIQHRTGLRQKATKRLWPRIAAAASILVFLSVGSYFVWHKPVERASTLVLNDVAPGSHKAVLTLANGQKIIITGAGNGTLATQANMQVKNLNGSLAYIGGVIAAKENQKDLMNTLATAMGGETSLTLADGTEVQLDAASSITYPVAFNDKVRRVTVTGQAYFKVKHNARQPFQVIANGQRIEDIGTEFNVNTYNNTTTTLVEGKIKVNQIDLLPGQQITNDKVVQVNTDEVAGWPKGTYVFNGQNIRTILNEIKRWYNVEVIYEPGVSDEKYYSTLNRRKNISQILNNLSYSNKVHFRIEGRRVTVMP